MQESIAKYHTQLGSKCIVAGEHSVLRGGAAVVVPFKQFNLQLSWSPKAPASREHAIREHGGLEVLYEDLVAKERLDEQVLKDLIKNCLISAGSKAGRVQPGVLEIRNSIPRQAGLGSSAAVLVGIFRWCAHMGYGNEEGVFAKAQSMENIFHGKSSGVDVLGVVAEGPFFCAQNTDPTQSSGWRVEAFSPSAWCPVLALADSGVRVGTHECVKRWEHFAQKSPQTAQQMDKLMVLGVQKARAAFLSMHAAKGQVLLTKALECAKECFVAWDLVGKEQKELMRFLKSQGALGVKPTGAGLGGYVLSLWPSYELALKAGVPLLFLCGDKEGSDQRRHRS